MAAVAGTGSEMACTEAGVGVLLRNDVIANSMCGNVRNAGDRTALCIGIGNDAICPPVTATNTYMYTKGPASMTAGRALTSASTVFTRIDTECGEGCGDGGIGGDEGGASGAGTGGDVGNEVAML